MDLSTLKSRLLARRAKWHEIAAQAGVHHKTIQRIADGRNIPNMATAERIVEAMRRRKPAATVSSESPSPLSSAGTQTGGG